MTSIIATGIICLIIGGSVGAGMMAFFAGASDLKRQYR
jgi:hypothetical protein